MAPLSLPDWPVIIDPHASRAVVISQQFRDMGPITKKPRPKARQSNREEGSRIDDPDAERF